MAGILQEIHLAAEKTKKIRPYSVGMWLVAGVSCDGYGKLTYFLSVPTNPSFYSHQKLSTTFGAALKKTPPPHSPIYKQYLSQWHMGY